MQDNVIEGRGVHFAYGRDRVLADLDISIPRGSIYGLLGPNGCGKSTLMRLALGQGRPFEGRLRVLGKDPNIAYVGIRSRIGFVPQENDLDPVLTVEQTLDLFATFSPQSFNRSLADEHMARLGLDEKRGERVGRLSGGWKQRLALVTAVSVEPEILLLDEPTAGLDAVVRRDFTETVIEYMAGGEARTTVICSHLLAEIEPLIDHVGLLAPGPRGSRMLVEARLDELKEKALVAELDEPPRALAEDEALLAAGGATMVFWCDDEPSRRQLGERIRSAGGRLAEVAELDEIFVRLFREALPHEGRRVAEGALHHG